MGKDRSNDRFAHEHRELKESVRGGSPGRRDGWRGEHHPGDRLAIGLCPQAIAMRSRPGEVRLVAAGPFAVVAALMLAVHVAFGGAAAGITLTLSPASWPLAATFAVIFVLMGAGLSLLYRKGSPGEKLVAVYDAHRRRLLVPAISLDVEREAIGGLEYRVSRVIDDDGGVNRVEPFFAELILRRRGGGESLYVVACTFGSGNLNSRAVNQFAASVGCSYGFVRIPADQRVTRSELRAVISEPF